MAAGSHAVLGVYKGIPCEKGCGQPIRITATGRLGHLHFWTDWKGKHAEHVYCESA